MSVSASASDLAQLLARRWKIPHVCFYEFVDRKRMKRMY